MRAALACVALVGMAGCSSPPTEPTPPGVVSPENPPLQDLPSLELKRLPGDWALPVWADSVPGSDRLLLILEQAGIVWTLDLENEARQQVLDLRASVGSQGWEQGLLGAAIGPPGNPNRLFVYYTDKQGDTVVASYPWNRVANLATQVETTILRVEQPAANHNGGMLAFGDDGYLYVGLGDGGARDDRFGQAQDTSTLLGSILRLDVSTSPYRSPADNPFAKGGGRAEIWAWGLRNPWRFSFEEQGGLWIADVGQDRWEEINFRTRQDSSGNYGWPLREASHEHEPGVLPQDAIGPVAEYPLRQNGRCSVTGGRVVDDPGLPSLDGLYVAADYCSGEVWAVSLEPERRGMSLLLQTDLRISSIGATPDGALVLVDHGGALHALVPTTRT